MTPKNAASARRPCLAETASPLLSGLDQPKPDLALAWYSYLTSTILLDSVHWSASIL